MRHFLTILRAFGSVAVALMFFGDAYAQGTNISRPTSQVPGTQRAALLVQTKVNDQQNVETHVGSASWRLEESRRPGNAGIPALRADIDLPGVGLRLMFLIEKNNDTTLRASHMLTLRFLPQEGSRLPPVAEIGSPQMRDEATPAVEPLTGASAKITDQIYIVALTADSTRAMRNLELIKGRGWFDLPIRLSDGRIAKITLEKGQLGERLLAQALDAWRPDGNVSVHQQTTVGPAEIDVGQAQHQRRVALVIGNTRYQNATRLENPTNDADLMAGAFKAVGFQSVLVHKDLTQSQTLQALREFSALADNADWAVVYYSGHGIEFGGANYLIPVEARLRNDRDIDLEAVDVVKVLSSIEGAKRLRLVILDACRDNPFASQMRRTMASRSMGRGLARIEPEAGTLIAYAAKHGEVALDGDGMNSPYAVALAKRLQQRPPLEVRRLFDVVRDDVVAATSRKQQPFSYGSVSGAEDFFFIDLSTTRNSSRNSTEGLVSRNGDSTPRPPESSRGSVPTPASKPIQSASAGEDSQLSRQTAVPSSSVNPTEGDFNFPRRFDPNSLTLYSGQTVPVEPGSSAASAVPRMSSAMWEQLDGYLIGQYKRCWSYAAGTGGRYVPQIEVTYNPDGSLGREPHLRNPPSDPNLSRLAESAMRALRQCNPLRIPPHFQPYYNEWKHRILRFDPNQMSN